ncbi:MAG: hypothetical protein ABIQ04_04745 [Candidatus Saccharimonadales bacterium]
MSEELISKFDIRGTEQTGLTVECAWNVGKAVADWLPVSGPVVVVYTGDKIELANASIEGLRLQGRDVTDAGLGDRNLAMNLIVTKGFAGAVVVGFDATEQMTTIELYQNEAKLIDSESGLEEIRLLVEAGNFVPAVVKGNLTVS